MTNSAPWKKPKPANSTKTKLTPKYRAIAKAAAAKAGRRYPNLVDNMSAARQQREAEAGRRSSEPRAKTRRNKP